LKDELPFFANGSLVGDYKPLRKYWEILRKKGFDLDNAFLKREDFEYLDRRVKENPGIDVASLINELTQYFMDRIVPEAAVEACREAYGVSFDRDTAVKKIAYIMAGWLIEAGKNTGILSLKSKWSRGGV